MRWPAVTTCAVRAALAVVLLATTFGTGPLALEPEAELPLRWEWSDAADPGGVPGGKLRLSIGARAPVESARLAVSVPPGIDAEILSRPWSETARESLAEDGTRRLRIDLGRLDPARLLTIELRLTAAPGAGGVVSFSVRGVRVDGRPQRSATGVAVGQPGQPGVVRDGAREFRGVRSSGGTR